MPDRTVPDHAVLDHAVLDQPVLDQPVLDQPVLDQPVPDQPVADQPVLDQPVPDQPVPEHAGSDHAVPDHAGPGLVADVLAGLDTHVAADVLDRLIAARADIRILDVRTPTEFEAAHIPGSYNVPLDTLGEHADELARHVSEPLLLVCRSGNRANRACERLVATGMPNVHVLAGGIQAWDDGRRAVRRGRQRWDLERQVRLVAGSLVLSGIVASVWVPALKYVSGAVGLGLTVAALSDTCAMGLLLAKLPYNRRSPSDVDSVVRQLVGARTSGPSNCRAS